MLEVAVWPVTKSLEGIVLEKELVSRSGIKVYIDAFEGTARLALESEGFVPHAQNITRERFTFERRKIRTIASYGFVYTPFSRDELDERPEECSSSFAELLARNAGFGIGTIYAKLNVYEREVLRYARLLHRPFRPADVKFCLNCGDWFAGKVLKSLLEKKLIASFGLGVHRIRQYVLEPQAYRFII